MSWQARFVSFLLRRTFKRRLARAQTIEDVRRVMNAPGHRPLPGTRIEEVVLGGIPGQWVTAQRDAAASPATLMYLHGGGYIACSPRTHRAITGAFALNGFRTFAPAYRLAPEHPYPAGLQDAVSAYRALLQMEPAERLVLAGDSAGGALAIALLLTLRDRGLPMPAAAALFSPYVDLAATGDSVRRNSERCAMFTAELFARGAAFYVSEGENLRDPLVSPLYADLHGLPPLLIHVGEGETLLDDSRRLAERAREAGVDVRLKIWRDVPHDWQLFHRLIPEGRESLREASEFLAGHVREAQRPAASSAIDVRVVDSAVS